MAQPVLKNSDRMYIRVDNLGRVIGSADVYVGKKPPANGRWVEITTCIEICCSTTSTTTTTSE